MKKIIWTIGHSTRSIEAFLALLIENEIQLLVDVRTMPGSNKFPHFNSDNLTASLHQKNISYSHMPRLGGRRKPNKNSLNTAWRNVSFRAYADYMETEDFNLGIMELSKQAVLRNTAIMCSEAVYWRCHRSLISDRMKFDQWQVKHIMATGKVEDHPYTSPAKIIDGELKYTG